MTWNSDGKIFALKTLDISKMDQKGIKNCLNEIRIICSIDDKFVCGYEEAFTLEKGEIMCIIMEYIGGGDLLTKIESCKAQKVYICENTIWKYLC